MSSSTLPAGWARPASASKWHYFPAGEPRSLCMQWALVGERDDSDDDSPQNCASCRRKVKALRRAGQDGAA